MAGCKSSSSDQIFYAGPTLSCIPLSTYDNLTVALQKINENLCITNQNNFVRELFIDVNDLPNPYTPDDICSYILSLPEEERTILPTDSKWNVILVNGTDIVEIYEIQNIGKGIITVIDPSNLLLLKGVTISPDLQTVLNIGSTLSNNNSVQILPTGSLFVFNADGFGSYLGLVPSTGPAASLPTASIGICDSSAITQNSLDFYEDKTLFKDTLYSKGIEYAGDYEGNFTSRSLVTKQYSDIPVSSSVKGIVNNISLQELGGVDKLINGVRIGKGTSTGISNTVFGVNSQGIATTGLENTSIGTNTLSSVTTGFKNEAIGANTLNALTTGSENTAIGAHSLELATTAIWNVGIGPSVMTSLINGQANTAIGYKTLTAITNAVSNVAIGANALIVNTASNNTSIGAFTSVVNTTGDFNTAVGYFSLNKNTTGIRNTGIGSGSGSRVNTGNRSVFIGYNAGGGAAAGNITGDQNLVLGYQSGYGITSGSANIIIESTTTLSGSISSGSNNIIINNRNVTGITTGSNNTVIGGYTGSVGAATSSTVLLGDGLGATRFSSDATNLSTLPLQTIALITADAAGKSILTKEYLLARVVTNTTTTALTAANLNAAYPSAVQGFKVQALSISGGGLIYEKTSTGWCQYSAATVV